MDDFSRRSRAVDCVDIASAFASKTGNVELFLMKRRLYLSSRWQFGEENGPT